MYGLYDSDGILRFINSDKKTCLAYAELLDLNSTTLCLLNLEENINSIYDTNFDLNQAKNNN